MSELVGHILKKLYAQAPEKVLEDPRQLEHLLQETCPDEKKAIRMVVVGLAREIPQRLLSAPENERVNTMDTLALSLSQEHAMHPRFGRWMVETWARALDLIPLNMKPVNIFAEAEQEYRKAVRAVLKMTENPGENVLSELAILRKSLMLSEEQGHRVFQQVKQRLTPDAETVAHQVQEPEVNRLGMGFLKVEAGTFEMGSSPHEYSREMDEARHAVTLTRDFYLQTHPVTQSQWQKVMGNNPSDFKGPNLPVENVSWNDIVTQFIPRLNARGDGTYRLPTEAEWEYAARAGGLQAYGHFEDVLSLEQYGWYNGNSAFKTHPVGTKQANPWGFYDMYGNVWEWCQDWYGPYDLNVSEDPEGTQKSSGRVMRGGCWFGGPESCRCAARGYMAPPTRIRLIGFRLVREHE